MIMSLRRRRVRAAFAIPMLSLFVLSACQDAMVRPSSVPLVRADGETLFRGLVLATGPVADQIPEIRDHYRISNFVRTEAQMRDVALVHDRLVSAIRVVDPSFFGRYREAMTSGNHLEIKAMMRESSRVTFRAVATLAEVQELGDGSVDPNQLMEAASKRMAKMDMTNPEQVARVQGFVRTMFGGPASAGVAADEIPVGGGDGDDQLTAFVVALLAAIYVGAVMDVVVVVNVVALYAVATEAVVVSDLLQRTSAEQGLVQEQLVNSIATLVVE
ncbi:MAG TPA: hypothetical protein VLK84_15865 [Longimicrobium sp.]|nr:hypothetical protein [Longimicrobium sp.]